MSTSNTLKTMGQSRKDRDAKTAKAKADLAHTRAPKQGNIGCNPGMVLTMVKDAPNRYVRPPQVQKILNYLEALGGSATVQEIMDLSEVATGGNIWKHNDIKPYRQDVAQVIEHYERQLLGDLSWIERDRNEGSMASAQAYVTIG